MSKTIPPLLPIFRSRQQAELLAWLLDDPSREASVSELSRTLGIPQPTVSRDVAQAERAGVVRTRHVGRTKLVSADMTSVYFDALRQLLVRSFGVPAILSRALGGVKDVSRAFIFGSWAARFMGIDSQRSVGDIDLLVLGTPDESEVYSRVATLNAVLGYEVQVTLRPAEWLESGTGSFHDTIVARPLVEITDSYGDPTKVRAAATASFAQA